MVLNDPEGQEPVGQSEVVENENATPAESEAPVDAPADSARAQDPGSNTAAQEEGQPVVNQPNGQVGGVAAVADQTLGINQSSATGEVAATPSEAVHAGSSSVDVPEGEDVVQTESLSQFAGRHGLPVNAVREANLDRIDDDGNITSQFLRVPR